MADPRKIWPSSSDGIKQAPSWLEKADHRVALAPTDKDKLVQEKAEKVVRAARIYPNTPSPERDLVNAYLNSIDEEDR